MAMLAAACGDDDDDGGGAASSDPPAATDGAGADTTSAAEPEGTTAADGTTAAEGTTAGSEPAGTGTETAAGGDDTECDGTLDDSLDEAYGVGAAQTAEWLTCVQDTPLAADDSLEPVVIGLINSQGDPSFSFPDITAGAEAATQYINEVLGGIGSDPSTGTPGRPVRLETCFVTLDPADSVACANEMASKDPMIVIQGFTQHGESAYPILAQAGAVNISGIPVSLADYTTEGVYGMAQGGGCVGAHPALIEYAVNVMGARRIVVPWLDIPAGRVCYFDLEAKPLDILKGDFAGPEGVEGSVPDLEYMDVPIPFGAPDLSTQASQILDFDPDAIIFSAPVGTCVSLANALAGLGWTAEEIPAVWTGACYGEAEMTELGDTADGMIFVSATSMLDTSTYPDGLLLRQAEAFEEAMADYQPDVTPTGNSGSIFQEMVTIWALLAQAAADGGGPESIDATVAGEAIGSTVNAHMWGGTPISCGEPVEGYSAICNTLNSATQWSAADQSRSLIEPNFDGAYIVAGTELAPEIAGG
ncbi:MAG: ABC transporter substrate-binding protein [Ilumatobacteraceae bacterium]